MSTECNVGEEKKTRTVVTRISRFELNMTDTSADLKSVGQSTEANVKKAKAYRR